jgi:hypothetical protein
MLFDHIREESQIFNRRFSCFFQCKWPHMQENLLLDSPIKYIYFCSGGVGQFAYINVLDR